jgi:hypothetical protein
VSDILTTFDVERDYLISRQTQKKRRREGMPFYRNGNRIRYRREAIESWIREQESKHTLADPGNEDRMAGQQAKSRAEAADG